VLLVSQFDNPYYDSNVEGLVAYGCLPTNAMINWPTRNPDAYPAFTNLGYPPLLADAIEKEKRNQRYKTSMRQAKHQRLMRKMQIYLPTVPAVSTSARIRSGLNE
jgi:hypothetical protein